MDDRDVVALWDFSQPAVSEARLREALSAAEGDGRAADVMLLRTQVARALGLQDRFAEANAELNAAASALDVASPVGRVYLDLERGRVLRSSGAAEGATPFFRTAFETAASAGLDALAADAAHMMALVGDPQAQVEWSERALAIATASTDPHTRRWISSVENNLGWTLHDLGRYEEAQEHFVRALAANEERGEPERIRIAHWTVARGLRSLGRYEEALAIQQRLAEQGPEDPYVYEELAELLTVLGRANEAPPYAERAKQLSS
jgi:tetratricopeptide (TPR) repeat protein